MKITFESEYTSAVQELKAAAAAYFSDGGDYMGDDEYDDTMRAVTEYENVNGITDGISTKVAAGAATGDVPHIVPMLSLDNVFNTDQFAAWSKRLDGLVGREVQLAVEPKMDGLAMSILYANGNPISMTTRGSGTEGEDRTAAIGNVVNLPTGVTIDGVSLTGYVRGEIVFTRAQFAVAQEIRTDNGKKQFGNARNGISGAIMGAEGRAYDLPCSFFAYDVADVNFWITSHTNAMDTLTAAGFTTAASLFDNAPVNVEQAVMRIVKTESIRGDLIAETDGVVVKANDAQDRIKAGSSSKFPRWAIAYKFPPNEVSTTLEEIIWQVGRTGRITPRARIAPILVGGTTVTYATLNNPADIARKGFMLGDHITVRRAGEVIPELVGPLVGARDGSQTHIAMPTSCPRCGGVIVEASTNPRCIRGRACATVESLAYAASRDALDIDALSTSIINRLADAGRVSTLADLLALTADDLADLPGEKFYGDTPANVKAGRVGQPVPLGAVMADKIAANIEKARTTDFARVLTALGIRGTGRSMSRRLAAHFGSMDALRAASAATLANVDKIGDTKAELIVSELAELSPVIDKMSELGVTMAVTTPAATAAASPQVLAGKSVCVTGSMVGPLAGKSRNEVNEMIEAAGGRAASSVSKSTSLLVAGEKAGSKVAKAQAAGVRIVTEDEFAAMVSA